MKFSWRNIILSVMVLLIIFPFLFMVGLSLSSDWRYPEFLPSYFGFRNWKDVLSSESDLLPSFLLSAAISLLVAVSSTAMGFMVSRSVYLHPKRKILNLLAYFPYVLAPVVFGACLSYFFLKLGLFGNTIGVIIAQFLIAFPYAMIFFSSFWSDQIKNYEELAATLGSSKTQTYTRVLLPLAKGMILICFFQTFLISWFEYGLTSVIGIGKVQTLTIKVFLFIKEANYYYGALSCCLLIFPPVILLYLNKRYVFKKLV